MSARELAAHRVAIVQRADLGSTTCRIRPWSWRWAVGLATACALVGTSAAILFGYEPDTSSARVDLKVAIPPLAAESKIEDAVAGEPEPRERMERALVQPKAPSRATSRAVLAQQTVSKPNPQESPRASPIEPAAFDVYRVAWDEMRAGEFSRAASRFEEIVATEEPALAEDSRYWMAVARARARQSQPAQQGLAGFLALFPDSAHAPRAQVMLGWLLVEAGDPVRAKEMFALAAASTDRAVRLSAAKGLFVVGDMLALNTPK